MKTPLLLTLCATALLSSPIIAEEGDPLRGKIKEHEGGDQLESAKHKLEELHQAGKHEAAAQLERRLRAANQHSGDRERPEGGSDAERKQHAMEAIKHLHAAGLHEPAERIEQMLRDKEKEAGQERREKEGRRGPEGVNPREGQEQMQRAMREMQEQTQRAFRETHEQMAKMARTIEELRAQLARQRGEGGPRKE